MVRYSIQVALLLLVAFYAWRRGGKPEKQVAAILVGMHVVSFAHYWFGGPLGDYTGIPFVRIALDFGGFLLFVGVALRADRWWPLWVASLQLIAVLAHVLRMIEADLPTAIYFVMERWPFWIMIGLTGLGTYLHSRRATTARVSDISQRF